MKKFLLVVILFICASIKGEAQINLVKNGDFEQETTCPYYPDQIKIAKYWSCIDTGYISTTDSFAGNNQCSPEYINLCGTNTTVAAPNNILFYQFPHSAAGMADVAMYYNIIDTSIAYQRDYLMGRLSTTLIGGQSYCVTFYVVMANTADFAINNIGAYLDDGSIDTNGHCGWPHTQYTPQVLDTTIINDTLNWVKIQGSFIANGTEKYITIGNFCDTAHTNKIRLHPGNVSYYEVDDVSVIATGATAYAGPDKYISRGDTATIGVDVNGGGMPCYWYVYGSSVPIDSGGTIQVHPLDTVTYVVAMDLCGTVTYDTVTVFDTGCASHTAASFADMGGPVYGGMDTLSFTYTGTGGIDSAVWSFGDGGSGAGLYTTHVYTVPPDSFMVCLMAYGACGNDTVCRWVHDVPCTVPAAAYTQSGTGHSRLFTYTGSTLYADSIVWYMGDGGHKAGDTASYYYTAAGSYTVCVVAFSRCGNDTACGVVSVVTEGASTFGSAQDRLEVLRVYPNPAGGSVTVEHAAGSRMEVYDVVGRKVLEDVITHSRQQVDIAQLAEGVYIIQIVKGDGERSVVRLVHSSQ